MGRSIEDAVFTTYIMSLLTGRKNAENKNITHAGARPQLGFGQDSYNLDNVEYSVLVGLVVFGISLMICITKYYCGIC